MRILLTGIDTLVLGYYCALDDGFFETLDDEWEARGKAFGELHVELGGVVHKAGRIGGGWKWALVKPDTWAVKVAQRSAKDLAPNVSIQFRSSFLWERGPSAAVQDALETLWPDLGAHPTRCIVSRADLCADWMEWELTPEHHQAFVRRVRSFAAHWEPRRSEREIMFRKGEAAVAALMVNGWPEGDAPKLLAAACVNAICGAGRTRELDACDEGDAERSESVWWRGQVFTGFTFGRGAVSGRVYRKDREIADVSGKRWFHDLWALAEPDLLKRQAFRAALADPEDPLPVWRCEFQLRREGLKSFRPEGSREDIPIDSYEDLMRHSAGLWEYLCGRWLRLTLPTKTKAGATDQRQRWPIHPHWATLRDHRWRPRAEHLLRERRLAINRERSALAGARAVARVIATHPGADVMDGLSLKAALQLFHAEANRVLRDHELTYPELVADAREIARSPHRTDRAFPALLPGA